MATGHKTSARRLVIFTFYYAAFLCRLGWRCLRPGTRSKISDSSSAAQKHSLSVPLNPAAGLNVEFDLIFEDKGLSRIITYVYHPSAVYFENPNRPRSCFEAASNFIL